MAHDHGHGNERRTFWAALLTGAFMFAEVAGGIISGSLALIADAAHMLTDAVSLTFAWFAFRLARRPADAARTFGYHRFQILVAFANGIALFFIIAWILYEGVQRFLAPVEVLGGIMLVVAAVGLVVNIAAFLALHGADRDNLNIRGAMLHVLGDLLGSVAALAAAVIILWTGWTAIDPLLSIVVALILLRGAWRLVAESGHILLEGTPRDVDIDEIKRDLLASVGGVVDIHHVHVWSLTQQKPLITLHARIDASACSEHFEDVVASIKRRIADRFGIDHATVEIERAADTAQTKVGPGLSSSPR